jgi:hypothetical protein
MTNQPALLIAGAESIRLPELVAAVHAAQAALDVALGREYAQECALHDAHQAARTAPPEQLRQADAWCAKAGDKLHTAILEVKRATEQLLIAQTSLSQATRSGTQNRLGTPVAVCSDVHRPRRLGTETPPPSATSQHHDHPKDTMTGRVSIDIRLGPTHPAMQSPHGPSTATS